MKKIIIAILVILFILAISVPACIKAINDTTDQCTKDMLQNKEIICD